MTSPTERTLKLLRKEGYTANVAEKYNAFIRRRIDLFGWIDVVAIKSGQLGVIGVQTTSGSNLAARIKKAKRLPSFKVWLESGNTAEFHGWSKKGARGKRKLWQVTKRRITLDSLRK